MGGRLRAAPDPVPSPELAVADRRGRRRASERTGEDHRRGAVRIQRRSVNAQGDAQRLQAVGVWPGTDAAIPAATLVALRAAPDRCTRAITRNGRLIGALTVEVRDARGLTRAENRLLDDVTGQAAWIIEHLTLSQVVDAHRQAGHLEDLTPRERQVLDLMARGFSNRAICDELFLSVKTVEPIVGAIFAKLDLQPDTASNRRVLAVLAYVRRE